MMNYRNETPQYKELSHLIKTVSCRNLLAWSDEQKRQFIKSINKGFPFGSFTLFKFKEDNKYTLIDGNQRYKTLQEYFLHPENYFPFEDLGFINALMNVINVYAISKEELKKLRTELASMIKDLIQQEACGKEPRATFLSKKIEKYYQLVGKRDEAVEYICDIQAEILREQRNYVNFNNLFIPCTIFTGKEKDLLEVFANANL